MTVRESDWIRLLAKVEVAPSGCWLWVGHRDKADYGRVHFIGINSRREYLAHRLFYELLVGPIPEGLTIDHLCRVRACVNPDHLEPVTQAENNRRGGLAVTHCPQGHEYTPENAYVSKSGCRSCRACTRARTRAWGRAKRAEAKGAAA